MKFGHLIPKKMFKFVAARFQIFRLICTQFNFVWGSTPNPTGEAYIDPQTF